MLTVNENSMYKSINIWVQKQAWCFINKLSLISQNATVRLNWYPDSVQRITDTFDIKRGLVIAAYIDIKRGLVIAAYTI